MKPVDGSPPAFPVIDTDFCGMTLRDYFAAKALQGVLASVYGRSIEGIENTPVSGDDREAIAQTAYSMADAMLKARVQ